MHVHRTTAGERFAHSTVGTPVYSAPELSTIPCVYNTKVDMWALGCVVYELAALHPPFGGVSQSALEEQIAKDEPPPLPGCYSVELVALVGDEVLGF
jgi:NIMA (never in mitosis gene a)-related kinase